jgi:hypothetical protein
MSAPTLDQPVLACKPTPAEPATLPSSHEQNITPTPSESAGAAPAPTTAEPANLHQITPTQAGLAGVAVGLGAGLIVAELVVPGAVLAVIGIVGISAGRGAASLFRGASRVFRRY